MASIISMVSLGARLATTTSSSRRAISRTHGGRGHLSSVKNMRAGHRSRSNGSLTVHAKRLDTDSSYNCVVNKEGVIIADDIPSGVYEVSAWWAGATKDGKEALAPKWCCLVGCAR